MNYFTPLAFSLCFLLASLFPDALAAQQTADFEELISQPGEVRNGSDGVHVFSSGGVILDNQYTVDTMFGDFWSGWSVSSVQDTVTAGFQNQYAARPGGGVDGSLAYALTYAPFESIMRLDDGAAGEPVAGMYIANTTYAYFSMLEGDDFAKQFGGEDGNDPDFFLLTIRVYNDGNLSTDAVELYLADYRFADNSQDYILEDWTFVDLSGLGAADSVSFTLSSSDNGMFGMNTPAYICVDQVMTAGSPNGVSPREELPTVQLYPNPVTDRIRLTSLDGLAGSYQITDILGKRIQSGKIEAGAIHTNGLSSGTFLLQLATEDGWIVRRFVKP